MRRAQQKNHRTSPKSPHRRPTDNSLPADAVRNRSNGSFVKVAETADVEPGRGREVIVVSTPVALFNVNGRFHAVHNDCLCCRSPLGAGDLHGNVVTCPLHEFEYDVRTGESLRDPGRRLARFDVRIEGNDVFISEFPISD